MSRFLKIFIIYLSFLQFISVNANNVKEIKDNKAKDSRITKSLNHLLDKESDIPNLNINVTTKDGIVSLDGEVDTRLQANRVIELASSVKGVKDVKTNDLEIKSSKEFLSDAYITAKVKGKIKFLAVSDQINKDYNLHVETTNKIVHIFGEVSDKKDQEIIQNSISSIIDVLGVQMNIRVAPINKEL